MLKHKDDCLFLRWLLCRPGDNLELFGTSVDLNIRIGKGVKELNRMQSFKEEKLEKMKLKRRGTILVA